jgi:hypothetical protein
MTCAYLCVLHAKPWSGGVLKAIKFPCVGKKRKYELSSVHDCRRGSRLFSRRRYVVRCPELQRDVTRRGSEHRAHKVLHQGTERWKISLLKSSSPSQPAPVRMSGHDWCILWKCEYSQSMFTNMYMGKTASFKMDCQVWTAERKVSDGTHRCKSDLVFRRLRSESTHSLENILHL